MKNAQLQPDLVVAVTSQLLRKYLNETQVSQAFFVVFFINNGISSVTGKENARNKLAFHHLAMFEQHKQI